MRSNGVACRRHCNAGAVQEARVSEETGFQDHGEGRERPFDVDGRRERALMDGDRRITESTQRRSPVFAREEGRQRRASRHGLCAHILGN